MTAYEDATRLLSMYDSGHPSAAAQAWREAWPVLVKLLADYEAQQRRLEHLRRWLAQRQDGLTARQVADGAMRIVDDKAEEAPDD